MDEPNLQEIHDFLIDLARRAGHMITSATPSTVDTKKNCRLHPKSRSGDKLIEEMPASDLVTETDKAVEDMVSSSLKSAYPSYKYVESLHQSLAQESPDDVTSGSSAKSRHPRLHPPSLAQSPHSSSTPSTAPRTSSTPSPTSPSPSLSPTRWCHS